MPQYRDGSKACIGDVVIAPHYGQRGHIVGAVIGINDAAKSHDITIDVALTVISDDDGHRRIVSKLPQSHPHGSTASECEKVL